MTITITAEKIPLSVLNNALEYFDSIIDMGFNGKYLRNTDDINGETTYYALSLTLHVDYMLSEIQSMRKILHDYTSGFECTENSVKHSKKDSVVPKTKLQKQLVQDSSNPEVANAVNELFKQVSGNTTEEIAANVVLTLFSHNFKRQATYDTYKKFIVAYAKAEKKPKSYRSLCDVVGKNIPATTQKKANALISQKLGVETTFMEFLKHMPNFATEDNKESSPEEVVLERPKKPPKRKLKQECGILKCFPKNDEFDRFLRSVFATKTSKKNSAFASKISRKNKVLTILNYMGLKQLSSNEIEVIKKLCIKHLYMFNFYNPEQNYTEEEKLILERFVNDFAKSLKEDANFISLKNFVKELSKIP